MKKIIKSSLLIIIMAMILFALTGCGQDKLIASKSTSAEETLMGVSSEEKVEITFKKDKVDKVTWSIECEKEEDAKNAFGLYTMALSGHDEIEVKQDGKKVIITMGSNTFASEVLDLDEDEVTKEKITKALEDDGYKIEK